MFADLRSITAVHIFKTRLKTFLFTQAIVLKGAVDLFCLVFFALGYCKPTQVLLSTLSLHVMKCAIKIKLLLLLHMRLKDQDLC